uniref:Polypeptide N-acetylgalactosaminyltransferase n=1 Tax=Strigamia maritima TaxID=126957 RepID=T1JEQ6_STRMM
MKNNYNVTQNDSSYIESQEIIVVKSKPTTEPKNQMEMEPAADQQKSPIKADEMPQLNHQKFINVNRNIPVLEPRTTEEELLDAEIEAMNKKIVPGLGEGGEGVTLTGAEKILADSLMKTEAFNIIAIEMKKRLDRYVKRNWTDKVRIIRAPERLGLIRARLAGAKAAIGKVVVFLDSHCEVNLGWLEPLLARIKQNRKVALVPIIEVIDDASMNYYQGGQDFFQIGSFTWSGHFTWINVPQKELDRRGTNIAPTRSPTMAGGLFAMEKDYFWEIGGYDEGMDVWGGENLEMSFRVWMCGGSLETIPCSRVGHIFRSFHPYTFPGNKDTHGINTVRMAEVWMDDYKRLFYLYRPDLKTIDFGDVTPRKTLRQKLHCEDFRWYLKNIVPEKFILDEDSFAHGRVRNGHDLCLDFLQLDEDNDYFLGIYTCHPSLESSQFFAFSTKRELRRETGCASASLETKEPENVLMTSCSEAGGDQEWKVVQNGHIVHVASKRCLDSMNSTTNQHVWLAPCNDASSTQKWTFDVYKTYHK